MMELKVKYLVNMPRGFGHYQTCEGFIKLKHYLTKAIHTNKKIVRLRYFPANHINLSFVYSTLLCRRRKITKKLHTPSEDHHQSNAYASVHFSIIRPTLKTKGTHNSSVCVSLCA